MMTQITFTLHADETAETKHVIVCQSDSYEVRACVRVRLRESERGRERAVESERGREREIPILSVPCVFLSAWLSMLYCAQVI